MAKRLTLKLLVWLVAAVWLLVALGILAVAQWAAALARQATEDLSSRLIPASAQTVLLTSAYTQERSAVRDYAADGREASRAQYEQIMAALPGQVQQVERLLQGRDDLQARLRSLTAAHEAWEQVSARPQLAAAAGGDPALATRIQMSDASRTQVRAVQARGSDLQAAIAVEQTAAAVRVHAAQNRLLASLTVAAALILLSAVGMVLVLQRWLLAPFQVIRRATDQVAAGDHEQQIPAVGPRELADLAAGVEQMRHRMLGALQERQAAEQGFRDLLETFPEAALHVDQSGVIVSMNAVAEDIFGYSRDELIGQPVEVLVPAGVNEEHPAWRTGYFAEPRLRSMADGRDVQGVHRDGHLFPVEVTLSSVTTPAGPLVSAAVRDISERLAAQAERERLVAEAEAERHQRRQAQTERLESLGQLVGGVAHDFNNLLNIILGYTRFVIADVSGRVGDDPTWTSTREDIAQINDAAERAAHLTRQLLTFGRRDVTTPEVLNLNDVVTDLEPLLRRTLGEHIELIVNLDADLWPIVADPGRMEQVLVNLAVNARDAMPTGGTLTIDTANTAVDRAYATARPTLQPGNYARLRVSDTGTGMDKATLARVFEPFFTTKEKGKGTGLGLATVYGIITQADGYPEIYSEPGLGTTFGALFPADEADGTTGQQGDQDQSASPPRAHRRPTSTARPDERALAESALTSAGESNHSTKVLLVEDEENLRAMVARILTNHGYTVHAAATIADALNHVNDLDRPIDILLTDVVMPTMLGRELAERAQALREGLPVLYMSGYAYDVLHTQGTLEAGVHLLEKPFTEEALITHLDEAITNPVAADSSHH